MFGAGNQVVIGSLYQLRGILHPLGFAQVIVDRGKLIVGRNYSPVFWPTVASCAGSLSTLGARRMSVAAAAKYRRGFRLANSERLIAPGLSCFQTAIYTPVQFRKVNVADWK
jgi:hypothetical protein